MKNLSNIVDEKMDDLPSQSRIIDTYKKHRKGDSFPYRKAKKWISSHAGKNIDEVFSKWVILEWIPEMYRNLEGIKIILDYPTIVDGEICTINWWKTSIYVDPITKLITVPAPQRSINYKKRQEQEISQYCKFLGDYHQLLNIDGIWYDILIAPTYNVNIRKYDLKTKLYSFTCTTIPTPKRHPATKAIDHYTSRTPTIISKRQLSSKELKKYNLKNT
jgi:hypothetical protein